MNLKPGYCVLIMSVQDRVEQAKAAGQFFKVQRIEPFKVQSDDFSTNPFSSVATAADSGFKEIDDLKPRDTDKQKELYYTECGFEDGCVYTLKIPSGTERFGVFKKKDVGKLTALTSPKDAPDPDFGFWLFTDDYPSINARNDTGSTVTPRVFFKGFKFNVDGVTGEELAKLQRDELPYTIIHRGGIFV